VTVDEVPDLEPRKQVSTARCARVSYLTHDGVRDIDKDLELYDRLENPGDGPPHMSPFEHVARPTHFKRQGNFRGWKQLRHEVFGR
jgi:thymidylate synthase ThyX